MHFVTNGPTSYVGKKAINQQTIAPPRITQNQQTMRLEEESTTTKKVRSRRNRRYKEHSLAHSQ
jgi:hypothetical protein